MKQNKTNKKLILLILLTSILLIGAISLYLIISSKTKKVLELKEIASSTQDVDIVSIRQQLNQLTEEIEDIDNYFIDSENVAQFLDRLDLLATDVFFEIQSVDLEEAKFYGGELGITMKASGEWSDVINFIIKIENLDKKILIDAVRLSSVFNTDTKTNSWVAVMVMRGITD